jgi:hypothetical protein
MVYLCLIISELLKLGYNIPCRSVTFVTYMEVAVKSLGNIGVGMPKPKHSKLLLNL